MWNSRKRTVTCIVFNALREYAAKIQDDIHNFHRDEERSEEVGEALRLTRTMRAATALVGSFALNRLVSLIEEVLESIAHGGGRLDDNALSTLTTMLEAVESYTVRIESRMQQSSPVVVEDRQDLMAAVRAFRRYRDLPLEEDDQAIASLFSTPPAFADMDGVRFSTGGGQNESAARRETPSTAAERDASPGNGEESAAQEITADLAHQQEISPELWEIFREEANDHIERIDAALRQLEGDQGNRELLQEVRRSAHTLKGAAGAVGLRVVTRLAHRMEDLLDALYEGAAQLDDDRLKLLAATADSLNDLCAGTAGSGQQQKLSDLYAAYDLQCGVVNEEQTGNRQPSGTEVAGPEIRAPERVQATQAEHSVRGASAQIATPNPRQPSYVRVSTSRLDGLRRLVGELIVNRTSIEQGIARLSRRAEELRPVLDLLRDVCRDMDSYRKAGDAFLFDCTALDAGAHDGEPLAGAQDGRADFDELEFDRFTCLDLWSQSLTEAIGVIGAVRHDVTSLIDESDAQLAQQCRLTLETQDRLFQIQMVPLSTIMPRLHRALREVASRAGKAVALVVDGDDVELEKTVLEELVEPLLHLLRNAVDHGVEPAAQRSAKGKPAQATVCISLSHFGTQVVIRIGDDGRGLDAEKIRAAAVKRGHVTETEAAALTPQELYRYIFLPGFSTASAISEISGRGVGMDVVRTKIEELKGRIGVDSVPDRGTSFTIRLPVSLATTRALMLTAGDELFAIPQKAISSIIRVAASDADDSGNEQRIRVDGQELPLIHLRDYLGIESLDDGPSDTLLVAVLGSGVHQVALHVDGILPGRDIVVQPLEHHLARAAGLLGATILGDGTVVPILDPTDLIHGTASESLPASPGAPERSGAWPTISVMIVDDSMSVRRVLQNVMDHAGWSYVAARDGVDALETLASLQRPPDVFLLDVEMPRMDGYELLRVLRQEKTFAETPIIMITSRAGDKHRQQAISLGASAYLTKPFQEEELIETIGHCLKSTGAERGGPYVVPRRGGRVVQNTL